MYQAQLEHCAKDSAKNGADKDPDLMKFTGQ